MTYFDEVALKIAELKEVWLKLVLSNNGYNYLLDFESSQFSQLMVNHAKIDLRYPDCCNSLLFIGGEKVASFNIEFDFVRRMCDD